MNPEYSNLRIRRKDLVPISKTEEPTEATMRGYSRTFSIFLALLLIASPLAGGCTPRVGGGDYAVSGAQGTYDVEYGTVVSFRQVRINNESSGKELIGAGAGGVLGGVLGSTIGGGSGRTIATVVGALGGAALGAVGANNIGNQDGVEVVVRLDSGRTLAVVQGADMVFTPGQQVMVLRGNGTTRVAPR